MNVTRCAARPDDLLACANETDQIAAALRAAIAAFDRAIEYFVYRTHGLFAALRWSDPLWSVVNELEDLASSVAAIAFAFEAAGGRGASARRSIVTSDADAIDGWMRATSWRPSGQLEEGTRSGWSRAVYGPHCVSWGDAGYRGSGFLLGPDGRRYPLVAPYVTRDGHVFNADDDLREGQPSVLDLDGRDPGWTTIYEQIDTERWRDAPSAMERVLAGVGSTAAGAPIGSTGEDVDAVVLTPGHAPVLRRSLYPQPRPEPSPPVYTPPAPQDPPPNMPGLEYPIGRTSVAAGGMNLAPVVLTGLVGAARADLGSHDAYDVVLQQNTDGRIRALYRRVFVGFDASGAPTLQSVYVTGKERNDQEPIAYAPRR
jgi:hypothetical protein